MSIRVASEKGEVKSLSVGVLNLDGGVQSTEDGA